MPMYPNQMPIAPSAAPQPAQAPSGLFGRLDQFRAQNPGVLAQFGAALAARSPAAPGFQQAAQMMQVNQQKKEVAEYLLKKGLADTPEEAATLASNPTLMQTLFKDNLIQDQFEARKKIAESMGMDMNAPGTQQYLLAGQFKSGGAANGVNYGVTPVFGTDAQGNIGMGVTGDDGSFKLLDTPGFQPLSPYDKAYQRAQGGAEGKGIGEAKASYESMKSKLPGLEAVVKDLDTLSEQATYTLAGQGQDWLRTQTGAEPRGAAVARTQYISTVNNQILPLLRDTFGAQFTEREGETLRATMGDPDKTPTEKQAVLKAFIEQKRRDIEALAIQTGEPIIRPPPASTGGGGASKTIGGKVYIQDANGEWYEQ